MLVDSRPQSSTRPLSGRLVASVCTVVAAMGLGCSQSPEITAPPSVSGSDPIDNLPQADQPVGHVRSIDGNWEAFVTYAADYSRELTIVGPSGTQRIRSMDPLAFSPDAHFLLLVGSDHGWATLHVLDLTISEPSPRRLLTSDPAEPFSASPPISAAAISWSSATAFYYSQPGQPKVKVDLITGEVET